MSHEESRPGDAACEGMVRKRSVALLLASAGLLILPACKKSEPSKPPNFFGTPPVVSELSITKLPQPKHFDCTGSTIDLCCVDPPTCTCCCQPDTVNIVTADLDLIQISAKVTDADGASDLLVILARFFDPPQAAGITTEEISLEMFDVGSTPVGSVFFPDPPATYNIITGDAVQGDQVFTRYFYMKSTTASQPDDCILKTDQTTQGGTYSQYNVLGQFPATRILNYVFHVEAVDRAGNITPSGSITLPVAESDVTKMPTIQACGPPTGNGGCQPPPP